MFHSFARKLSVLVLAALLLLQPLAVQQGFAASSGKTTPTFSRALKLGSKGTDVQAVQKRLKELGYFKTTVTTNFGSVTQSAVKAFQKAKKLSADGIVGRTTFNALFGTTKPSTASNASGFTRTLKVGCKGTDVQAVQKRLKDLGYFKTTVTTTFGSATQNAVKAFQKAKKLSADGIVGRTTYDKLFAGVKATASPKATKSATPKPTASSANTAGYGRLQNQTALKKGDSGDDVRDLQMALKQKGFFKADITGKYETTTQDAIMKFQRSVGLDTDGIAGNYTLSALYSLLNPPDLASIKPWPDPAQAVKWAALPVEKLDWNDAAPKAFPKGSDAVVIDVKTGYTFKIRRTGGTLHADVEPLTAKDTATLYKTAGNTFTWARHAIWVIVGNRRLAASMNCMPHGYDSISGNDMKGQFCIHFVNSKTHGTLRVDPDHQKAIEVAYTTKMVVPNAPTAKPTATPTPTPGEVPTPTPTDTTDPNAPTATPEEILPAAG